MLLALRCLTRELVNPQDTRRDACSVKQPSRKNNDISTPRDYELSCAHDILKTTFPQRSFWSSEKAHAGSFLPQQIGPRSFASFSVPMKS